MQKEESFGIIPLKKKEGIWYVFLIQHRKGRYWGFPKGHAEEGESPLEAAFRELFEETNLQKMNMITDLPLVEEYQFMKGGQKVSKKVTYFVAQVIGEVSLQEAEVFDGVWVSFEQAFSILTHKEGKDILHKVAKILE